MGNKIKELAGTTNLKGDLDNVKTELIEKVLNLVQIMGKSKFLN